MCHYICTILCVITYAGCAVEDHPKVSFPQGSLIGKYVSTREGRQVEAYLGIPYAEPPVGILRFQPPQPKNAIFGDMLAHTMPHHCSQASYKSNDSEDCLYLNVFTPKAKTVKRLAVYVYIHGGKNYENGIAEYTPDYLLDEDVLLVTVQYRLGLFGFLSTGDNVIPGNMALKDVRCGLRWVRNHIRRFGGDPEKVTVGGHSWGASLVHMLMTFSSHEALFRAGISESGTALSAYIFVPPEQIKRIVNVIANVSSCPKDSISFAQCLRTKSAKDLVEFYDYLCESDNNPLELFEFYDHTPSVAAVIEPDCVTDRIVTGNPWHHNISLPYLVGVTSKEYLPGFFVRDDGVTPANFTLFDSTFNIGISRTLKYQSTSVNAYQVPSMFRHFYLANESFSRSNFDNSTDGVSDAFVIYPSFEAAMRAHTTYFYYYDFVGPNTSFPVPSEYRIGAVHADELYNFFPIPAAAHKPPTEADIKLSKKLVKMWSNFITYLDPTHTTTQGFKWIPFHPQQSYLYIKQDGMQMEHPFFPDRMSFWRSQPYPFRNDKYGKVPCFGRS